MAYKNHLPLNHLLTNYKKLKDVSLKNEAQIKYKQCRNLLSNLMKESKKSYFTIFFQNEPKWLKRVHGKYKQSDLFKRIA